MNRATTLLPFLRTLLVISFLAPQVLAAQSIPQFDGKWAFTGLRTTVFKAENEKLYVGMIDYADTTNFNRFVQGLPLDSAIYNQAIINKNGDTIIIEVNFPAIDHRLKLLYSAKDSSHILFTGDVFYDSSKVIVPNINCTPGRPACSNRLYDQNELKSMMKLKTTDAFTRDDAFEFLTRLNGNLKSRCNKCYAGFTDAYMNEILIEMGFNPIIKRTAARSIWYNTSGFTFYIKNKYSDDARILKLTDYIFDSYLK